METTRLSKYDLYYLLGFGFLDFKSEGTAIALTKKRIYGKTVEDISFKIYNQNKSQGQGQLVIDDEEIVRFLGSHGVLTPKRYMPTIDDEYGLAFTAGYFDGYGEFSVRGDNARITVTAPAWAPGTLEFISKHWKALPHGERLMVNGYKALDVCGSMYKNVTLHNSFTWNQYIDMLNWEPGKSCAKKYKFQYAKLTPRAVAQRSQGLRILVMIFAL